MSYFILETGGKGFIKGIGLLVKKTPRENNIKGLDG